MTYLLVLYQSSVKILCFMLLLLFTFLRVN